MVTKKPHSSGSKESVSDLPHDLEDPHSPQSVRRRAFRCDISVRELCEANGLTEDVFVREVHLLSSLDLFMACLEDVRSLSHFGGLTVLCFINIPNLVSVKGLDACCPNLERVVLTECGLATTEGLEHSTRINSLQLSSNRLETLVGLRGVKSLRKLWANDNLLKGMEGLSEMTNLEELWLCRNRISEVGHGLPRGTRLRELNLAHNRIGCFKELLKLSSLEGLRGLTLQDPHFGENPVCGLSNYRTYVAHHLTQLTSLDMEVVSVESKAFANTVFLKKRMYYNMRSRTVKRQAGHVIREATELCSHQGANLQTTLTHLQWQKKHIEQRRMTACAMAGMTRAATGSAVHPAIAAGPLGDASSAEVNDLDGKNVIELLRSDDGADMKAEQRIGGEAKANSWYPGVDLESEVDTAQLEAKGQALAQAVLVVESVLQKMEDQLDAFKEVVDSACQRAVSELMLEFDSGGNVRFEEGDPRDVWFSSCVALVKSRMLYQSNDTRATAKREGASSAVKVSRVIRIHNRFLRNRFERRVREARRGSVSHEKDKPEGEQVTSAGIDPEAAMASRQKLEEKENLAAPFRDSAGRSSQAASSAAGSVSGGGDVGVLDGGSSDEDGDRWASTVIEERESWCRKRRNSDAKAEMVAHDEAVGLGALSGERRFPVVSTDSVPGSEHIANSVHDPGPRERDIDSNGSSNVDGIEEQGGADRGLFRSATGNGIHEKCERGTGTACDTCDARESTTGWASERRERTKTSARPPRKFEYVFLTGKWAVSHGSILAQNSKGSGVRLEHPQRYVANEGNGARAGAGAVGGHSAGVGESYKDLLKVAEDGFGLSEFTEREDVHHDRRPADEPRELAQQGPDEEKEDNAYEGLNRCRSVEAFILSSHLREWDLKGVDRAGSGFSSHKYVAGGNPGFNTSLGPSCRVVVARVYTGSSRRVSRSEACSGGSMSRRVLMGAWKAGCKSVCVSSPIDGHEGDGVPGRGSGVYRTSARSGSRHQEWYILDGTLALPEYIVEFDISREVAKDGRVVKDDIRKQINTWRHRLASSYGSSSRAPTPPIRPAAPRPCTPLSIASGATSDSVGGDGGRAEGTGKGDILPFLIPLARLARQLEIDAASYTRKHESRISMALRMKPSAPTLSIYYRGSKDGAKGLESGVGGGSPGGDDMSSDDDEVQAVLPLSIAPKASSLLTRLSLHGQGIRKIEGFEAFPCLEILILSFNEISCVDGLVDLPHLRYLDLGYNLIKGVVQGNGHCRTDGLANAVAPAPAPAHAVAALDPKRSNVMLEEGGNVSASASGNQTAGHDRARRIGNCRVARSSHGASVGRDGELPSLTRLELNNNIIHNLDDLKAIWGLAPSLSVLDLRGNPLRSSRIYRGAAIRDIPGLEVLDGRAVTRQEFRLHHACRSLTLDMLRQVGRRNVPRTASSRVLLSRGINPNEANGRGPSGGEDQGQEGRPDRHAPSPAHAHASAQDGGTEGSEEADQRGHKGGGGGRDGTCDCSNESQMVAGSRIRKREEKSENQLGDEAEVEGAGPREKGDAQKSHGSHGGRGDTDTGSGKFLCGVNAGAMSTALTDMEEGYTLSSPTSAPATGHRLDPRNYRSNDRTAQFDGTRHLRELNESENQEKRGPSGSGDYFTPSPSLGLVLEEIELITLNNMSLHKLDGMGRLSRLRVADLSGNELHDISPLGSCLCLEELNLERNELTTAALRDLGGLRQLCKLDLGYNQISDLRPLCELTTLNQLSLEGNLLQSLRGLSKLVNLMELYCGNNEIRSASEVDRLRALPRLMILDMSGNAVCSTPHFRLLVLFKTPNLKVLDGVAVSGSEMTEAKLKFIGKLTEELIWSKYDPRKVETLKYLDLSRGKWRSVEVLATLPFVALQEVNLDRNYLVDFIALGGLQSLGVLRLSYNRIEAVNTLIVEARRWKDVQRPADETGSFPQLEGNSIGSLAGLNRCPTLVEVNLDGNKIRQLGPPSALSGLGSLRKLRLEDNGLRALSPGLAISAPALLSLSLAQNRLCDPAELDRLGPLPNLVELSVHGNPMARRPYSRSALLALFPSLIAVDSTDITSEEKRQAEAVAGGNPTSTMMKATTPASGARITMAAGLGAEGPITAGASSGAVNGTSAQTSGVGKKFFTVGTIGNLMRTVPVASQSSVMGGYSTSLHSGELRPAESLDSCFPVNGVAPAVIRDLRDPKSEYRQSWLKVYRSFPDEYSRSRERTTGDRSWAPSTNRSSCGSIGRVEERSSSANLKSRAAPASSASSAIPFTGESRGERDDTVEARHRSCAKSGRCAATKRLFSRPRLAPVHIRSSLTGSGGRSIVRRAYYSRYSHPRLPLRRLVGGCSHGGIRRGIEPIGMSLFEKHLPCMNLLLWVSRFEAHASRYSRMPGMHPSPPSPPSPTTLTTPTTPTISPSHPLSSRSPPALPVGERSSPVTVGPTDYSVGGGKRPIKLTSMNFSAVPACDYERRKAASRCGIRSANASLMVNSSTINGSKDRSDDFGGCGSVEDFTGSSADEHGPSDIAGGRWISSGGSLACERRASFTDGQTWTGAVNRRPERRYA